MKWSQQIVWWQLAGLFSLGFIGLVADADTNAVPKKLQSLTPTLSSPSASATFQLDISEVGIKGAWKSYPQPGSFIMSLARDSAGNLWAGTEEHGVWQFSPNLSTNAQWKQFTTKDGLGDDYVYSVAVDKQGRIWVGHLNHGVSVYNGTRWQNYDVPNGPIGERIFKIAVCPVDGDVWLGTSAGLTRYSVSKDEWTHYTKNSGKIGNRPSLPSDQISAIAFDAKGNIYVGTQCDGVAMASRAMDYRDWRKAPLFTTTGLPSRLINDLLVSSNGTLYVVTDGGLAWSNDCGNTWQFRHGRDYPGKIKGLAGGPPPGWSPSSLPKKLLPEDYITCLAEDAGGVIWLGFRQKGLLPLSGQSNEDLEKIIVQETGKADYGRAILPMPDGRPWLASYGGGLLRAAEPVWTRTNSAAKTNAPVVTVAAPLPLPAVAPELAELNGLLKEIEAVPSVRMTNGTVMPLEDDWRTEGQWLGRYGRFCIVLCANWSPKNDVWGAGWDVMYDARMGLNHRSGDSMRYWVHWLATDQNRCLEMSPTYLHSRVLKNLTTWEVDRRQSEWDDHGETYPTSQDGPHLYCSLSIPEGLYYLSLYDVNKDGHSSRNKFRDYQISIRPHPGRTALDQHIGKTTIIRSFYDITEFNQKPELAHGRIVDFWGGVYKRFLVRGPTKLTIQVHRNYSHNTILAGVMLDLVDELPPPYYCTRQEWETRQPKGAAEKSISAFVPATTAAEAAQRLAAALAAMPAKNETWWAENKRRFYLPLLRWQLAQDNSTALATSYYQLNLFSDWEKQLQQRGVVPAREIEKSIRWDGVTYSCAGMGNKMISDYVKVHPPILGK